MLSLHARARNPRAQKRQRGARPAATAQQVKGMLLEIAFALHANRVVGRAQKACRQGPT
jgi:hypothetical protein